MYQIMIRTKSGSPHFGKRAEEDRSALDGHAKVIMEGIVKEKATFIRLETDTGGIVYIHPSEVESVSIAEYDQHPF